MGTRFFPRLLFLLQFILSLASCGPDRTDPARNAAAPGTFTPRTGKATDTLPNGMIRVDRYDSSLFMYYRDVIGTDTLKDGYITCYGAANDSLFLFLRYRDSLMLLNKKRIGIGSAASVGILEAEFDNSIIILLDNGNSVPSTYMAFEKKTGTNLLGKGREAWDFTRYDDTLFLLCDNHLISLSKDQSGKTIEPDSIFLVNTISGKVERFEVSPVNSLAAVHYMFDKLDNRYLTVTVIENMYSKESMKMYKR